MNSNLEKSSGPRSITPLWILTLFISLTETVLGIGVTQTVGGIQVALLVFVMTFPVLIAIVFFYILWERPFVFYSPGEYKETDVTKYVKAMQSRYSVDNGELYNNIQSAVHDAIASKEVVTQVSESINQKEKLSLTEISELLQDVANQASKKVIDESFISIDLTDFRGHKDDYKILPYNPNQIAKGFS